MILFGLILGSFMGCIITRTLHNESYLKGRSHCDHCHHPLAWFDLIPVLSYLKLGGKCRYCGFKIPKSTLYVEIYGMCLGLIFHQEPWLFLEILILTTISIIDYKTMWIPDSLSFSFVIVCVIAGSFTIEALLLPLFLWMVNHIYKEIIGAGDLILLSGMGFFIGMQGQIFILLIASLLGLIYCFQCGKNPKNYIPLAPFLSIAYLVFKIM